MWLLLMGWALAAPQTALATEVEAVSHVAEVATQPSPPVSPSRHWWGDADAGATIVAEQAARLTARSTDGERWGRRLQPGESVELPTGPGLWSVEASTPVKVIAGEGAWRANRDWSKRQQLEKAAAALTLVCRTSTSVRVLRPQRAPIDRACAPTANGLGTVDVAEALPADTQIVATSPILVFSTPEVDAVIDAVPDEGYVWLGAAGTAPTPFVSLGNDNRLQVGERRHWLRAQEALSIDAGALARGAVVRATAPVIALEQPSASWVPLAWAGTQFLLPADAVRRVWLWSAGDTPVTWQQGETIGRLSLTADEAQSLTVQGEGVLELRSESPILVSAELTTEGVTSPRQVAVPPASDRLLGVSGGTLHLLTATDQAATVAVRDSNGHAGQHDVRAGATTSLAGDVSTTTGVHLTASAPIAAWTLAADGTVTPLVPETLLGPQSAIDHRQPAWVVCASTDITLRVRRSATETRTYACAGKGVGAVRIPMSEAGHVVLEASGPIAVLQGDVWSPRLSTTTSLRPAAPQLHALPARTRQASLEIDGTADPTTLVELRVNEASRPELRPDADGRFAAAVPLAAGRNEIYAVAHDTQGASEPSALSVVVRGKSTGGLTAQALPESTIPILDPIASPTSNNPETLTGTTLPGLEVRVFVDGELVRTVTADGSGAFSAKVPLDDGLNTITARAWDGAEESADSAPLTVEYVNNIPRTQGGTIATDTVWTAGSGPYTITSNLVVPAGVEFRLMPGATLKFNATTVSLQVSGTLIVRGTAASEVVFTSAKATPVKGDWNGVWVLGDGFIDADYARLEYARWGALYFSGGEGLLKHTTVRASFYGVWILANSSPVFTDGCEITGNDEGFVVKGNNTAAQNPLPVITGSSLYGNGNTNYKTESFGNGAAVVLNASGNWWGTTDPAVIAAKVVDYSDSTSLPLVDYSGYVGAAGGTPVHTGGSLVGPIATDRTITTGDYQLLGNMQVEAGVTLTIDAGALIKATGNWTIRVYGTLVVRGTAEAPVVFTSGQATPAKGNWNGIQVLGDGYVDFDHARVEYARWGALYFSGGEGLLKHTTVRASFYGVWILANSSPVFTDGCEITGNDEGFVVKGNNTAAQNPLPVITGSSLYGNGNTNYKTESFGNGAAVVLNATGNWWGTADPAVIAVKVVDYSDSTSLPLVDYSGYVGAAGGTPVHTGGSLVGPIATDRTIATGDYQLLGNMQVEAGVTLTIDGGALIKATGNWTIRVYGTLVVRGTAEAPVVFTSGQATPAKGNWNGIQVLGDGYIDFDHARVEYARWGALYFSGGEGLLKHTTVRASFYGVWIKANSSPVFSDGCEITGNDEGFLVAGNNIASQNPLPVITGSSLYGNYYINYKTEKFGDPELVVLNASGNWWGTTDPIAIANKIAERADHSSYPSVDWNDFKESAGGLPVLTAHGFTSNPITADIALGTSAVINYTLNTPADLRFTIIGVPSGAAIRDIDQSFSTYGKKSVAWDGRDNAGNVAPDGGYRYTAQLQAGVRTANITSPSSTSTGSGLGTIPARYNVFKNEFWKIWYTNSPNDGLIRMQVDPAGAAPPFYPVDRVYYPAGSSWIYWDGRDPAGNIVTGQVDIFFFPPETLNGVTLRVANSVLRITGTQSEANIEVKSDPYLVTHSYEQLTRMVYRLSHDAYVTFALLPPGVTDPGDPSAILLVNDELQVAKDSGGLPLDHTVEWRGYDLADSNAIRATAEGAYTFAIEARSAITNQTTLYRGVVQLYQ